MSLDLAAIAAWTAANRRARDEYAAHPITACLGIDRAGGDEIPCDRSGFGGLCPRCLRARAKTKHRMRKRRQRQKEKK